MAKKAIISYDVRSCPESVMFKDVIRIFQETGMLLYQGSFRGIRIDPKKPEVLLNEDPNEVILVDLSSEAGKEIYNKIKENEKNKKSI